MKGRILRGGSIKFNHRQIQPTSPIVKKFEVMQLKKGKYQRRDDDNDDGFDSGSNSMISFASLVDIALYGIAVTCFCISYDSYGYAQHHHTRTHSQTLAHTRTVSNSPLSFSFSPSPSFITSYLPATHTPLSLPCSFNHTSIFHLDTSSSLQQHSLFVLLFNTDPKQLILNVLLAE